MNLKIPLLIIGATLCLNIQPANASYTCLGGRAADIPQIEQDIQNGIGNVMPSYTSSCGNGATVIARDALVETDSYPVIEYLVYDCRCPTGYTSVSEYIGECNNMQHVISCTCKCSNCTSDSDYSNYGTGYQRKAIRSCDCSSGTATCKTTYQYRCAAGYSGSSTNGTSGCSQCPEAPDTYTNSALTAKARGTSAAGTTSQNSCYLAAGTYYDTKGTFGITGTSCTY